VFWQRPVDDIPLEEVAGRAGVSVQTVIRRFGGKQGLLAAAAERETERVRRQRDQASVTGSSRDNRPASAGRGITVATIDLAKDPTAKRVSAVTGSPVVASATPLQAAVTAESPMTPIAAPGTACMDMCSRSRPARSRSLTGSI
jgi:hypothetical protein